MFIARATRYSGHYSPESDFHLTDQCPLDKAMGGFGLTVHTGRDRTNIGYGDPDSTRGEFRHMCNSKRGGQFLRRKKGCQSRDEHARRLHQQCQSGKPAGKKRPSTIRTANGTTYCQE